MQLTCPKCHHVNPSATGSPADACPSCGAIYAKAIAATMRTPARAAPARRTADKPEDFLAELRSASAYPAFRTVIGLATVLGYLLAAIVFVGAAVSAWPTKQPGLFVGGLVGSVVIFVLTRVFKEMWLMLADMSDATIRMASQGRSAD